jgi:hypothetical protein
LNAETTLQQQIRLALGTRSDLRLFRNQVGQLPDPRTGRPVQFGLARGSADLIGWRTITITPEHGRAAASLCSPALKSRRQPAASALSSRRGSTCVQQCGGIAGDRPLNRRCDANNLLR